MASQNIIAILLLAALVCSSIVRCQVYSSSCQKVSNKTGFISDSRNTNAALNDCWVINVAPNTYTSISIESLSGGNPDCNYQRLTIKEIGDGKTHKFCAATPINQGSPIIAFKDFEVGRYMVYARHYTSIFSFKMNYQSVDIACAEKGHFKCSNETCIPNSKVCDGSFDCPNKADELICEMDLKGIAESKSNAIKWLMGRRSPTFGWRDNTHRAVIALYLASQTINSTKNEKGLIDPKSRSYAWSNSSAEHELIQKHLDLQASLSLLKKGNKLSVNQLSMFVNALVVSCQDPRHFYGFNLVQMLKERLSSNILNLPVAYLALCNADEPLPDNAAENLDKVLRSTSKYPFLTDVHASAVMAASCLNLRLQENGEDLSNSTLKQSLEETLDRFRDLQREDGTFGNVYTTALITQAFLSSGEYISRDARLKPSIKYLMQEVNSTSADFLAVYLTLPLLNWRTLADVHRTNCDNSSKPDLITISEQTIGSKMRVKYSLCVGDEKDLVHTMSLRVPHNISAFEVMQLAQAADAKYKFQWKQMGDQKYVYEIANIINDSENGHFWLLYVVDKDGNTTHPLYSPEEVVMHHDEQLILWYKTADI